MVVTCGYLGCHLPNLHAGMHQTKILGKRNRSTECHSMEVKQNTNNNAFAKISSSPYNQRVDMKINIKDMENELMKNRLKSLKKQVDDICNALHIV